MRRRLMLIAALLTTAAVAACSDISAPRRDDPNPPTCKSGYQSGVGFICSDNP